MPPRQPPIPRLNLGTNNTPIQTLINYQEPVPRVNRYRPHPSILYDYRKLTYMISKSSYNQLCILARKAHYISSQTNYGLSDYLNSITLTPNFIPEELEVIHIRKRLQLHHGEHLNGDGRWPRKFALLPDTIKYLADIGLEYMLWQKQPTDTALVSGTLEAFGNGKFLPLLRSSPLPRPVRPIYTSKYVTLNLTLHQIRWIKEQAKQAGYEPERNNSRDKSQRGLTAFVKDFIHLDFIPYDSVPHDTPFNTPPLRNDDEGTEQLTWRTTPQLQEIFDHVSYVTHMPYWPFSVPDGLDFDMSRVKQLLELQSQCQ